MQHKKIIDWLGFKWGDVEKTSWKYGAGSINTNSDLNGPSGERKAYLRNAYNEDTPQTAYDVKRAFYFSTKGPFILFHEIQRDYFPRILEGEISLETGFQEIKEQYKKRKGANE